MARPSDYTQEIAEVICERLADGKSLRSICLAEDMPSKSTVFRWLALHKEFQDHYARAREAQADSLFEDSLDIADDGSRDYAVDEEGRQRVDHDHITRSRLRVDTRKWMAGKLYPKKYGERSQVELTGKDGGPIETKNVDALTDEELAAIASAGRPAPTEPEAGAR